MNTQNTNKIWDVVVIRFGGVLNMNLKVQAKSFFYKKWS